MRRFFIAFLTVSICFSLLLLLGASDQAYAQVAGKINVKGVPDKYKSANANQTTSGLKNVGVGTRVVMEASAVYGTGTKYADVGLTVTGATWGVTGPKGVVTFQDTSTGTPSGVVYFVPDTVGAYTVTMTATTDSGTAAQVSITVTAANWSGVGVYKPSTTSLDNFQCSPCHSQSSGEFSEWLATNHATVFPRRVDETAGHFSDNCLACHTVGYSAAAANNGFDDIASSIGFHVPPNHAGVYDSLLTVAASNDTVKNMLTRAGIQCEDCHGPAGAHKASGDPSLMAKSWSSEVCAPCHFSSDRHPKGYSWDASAHARSMVEGASPEYMDRPTCNKCHTAQGFVNVTIDGNPEPSVPSGQKLYADGAAITCQACHDPHNNSNPSQLRRSSVAEACTGCHITNLSSHGMHHSPQTPMLEGVDAITMTPTLLASGQGNWAGWELPGYTYENSTHSSISERCVECHMANTPTYDPTYATPDTLLNKVGGHTFSIVYEGGMAPGDTVLNDVGCRECHGAGVSLEFVEQSQSSIHALLDTLAALLPQSSGSPRSPLDAALTTTIQKAGSYNYYFVANDGSFGVHNHAYAKALLQSSIEQLKLGAGAASLTSIKDVPKDQGQKVQLVWNKFPAEGFSYNRVENYGVWRQDPIIGTALKAPTYTDMLRSTSVGSTVSVAGYVWTYVAEVPASNLTQYSYVAETMFDSTVTSGQYFTKFFIAGYNADNSVVYQSPIDSGYSVDNIAPLAVTGFQVDYAPAGVNLQWKVLDSPENADVSEFAIYRSTSSGFTPSPANLIAKVTTTTYFDASVTYGPNYYYKVAAIDNSGNQGAAAEVVVTGVEELGGVPTEFALRQNYPNPFNPSTDIRFALPQESVVRLSVYNLSGELISTVVNGALPAGNYKVTWHGTTDDGIAVSTGVYLYRLQAGDYVSTRKMVLIK